MAFDIKGIVDAVKKGDIADTLDDIDLDDLKALKDPYAAKAVINAVLKLMEKCDSLDQLRENPEAFLSQGFSAACTMKICTKYTV